MPGERGCNSAPLSVPQPKQTNLRDERYLPFENAGVISDWQLELPANPSQDDPSHFDYNTISDVILHIRYTARDGGAPLRSAAMQQIKDLIDGAQAAGSVRLFSVRHEFAVEWAKFLGQTPGPNKRYELALTLRPEHYPFWSQGRLNSGQGRLNSVVRVDLFAQSADDPAPAAIDISDRADKTDAGTQRDPLTKVPIPERTARRQTDKRCASSAANRGGEALL